MAEREVKQWITVNGVHVPIFEGETKKKAIQRFIDNKKQYESPEQTKQRLISDSIKSLEHFVEINDGKIRAEDFTDGLTGEFKEWAFENGLTESDMWYEIKYNDNSHLMQTLDDYIVFKDRFKEASVEEITDRVEKDMRAEARNYYKFILDDNSKSAESYRKLYENEVNDFVNRRMRAVKEALEDLIEHKNYNLIDNSKDYDDCIIFAGSFVDKENGKFTQFEFDAPNEKSARGTLAGNGYMIRRGCLFPKNYMII